MRFKLHFLKQPNFFSKPLFLAVTIAFLFGSCSVHKKASTDIALLKPMNPLASSFKIIPDSMQTSVYWYWISDNISKEGVIRDLESMKAVGINRAFIGNIGRAEMPYGKVKIFTPEWWDILHTALKTATKLGIEIGIFNSPGWSQSGGPWVKPEQSMRYITSSELKVKGPFKLNKKLEIPAANFQDVNVLAYPMPRDYNFSISHSSLTSLPIKKNIKFIMDGNENTVVDFASKQEFTINISTKDAFTLRSITIQPAHRMMRFEGEVQVKSGNEYHTIKNFVVDRSNSELNTGFIPFGPAVISLPATKASEIRLIFKNGSENCGIADIKLSSSPRVENYIEKTLAKMFPTPLPYWKEYQWKQQPEVNDKRLVIDPKKVIDISQYMTADGTLYWDVPPGEWIILRNGMTPTNVVNSPASPEGTGRETDKMSKEHIAAHFNAFLGEIMRRIPAEDRTCWKKTVEDSYETGGQNWSDNMIPAFKLRFGYDPSVYMPVIGGKVVGSEEQSDRFLWDLRRFIADQVAYEYVAGLREISHKNGLTTWLENYGHWGFPGEFLQYGGQSDEVGGEFWSEGELGNIENRAASSCAHIYGKVKVSAESFTCGGAAYSRYPAMMKPRGDRFFTEGINNTLLHLYIEQAYSDKVPGLNADFSNEFNRLNTWYYDMDMFIKYLKRCNFMLQQGKYVADVAYFIGEDAPKMTGVRDPELPAGYSFDYINAEVIKQKASVKDGYLVLEGGMKYKVLVLPKLETMRPEFLQKIKDLVNQGLCVLGPAPTRSPSLENFPVADSQVQQMASELWGHIDGKNIKIHRYGKGIVLDGMDMQEALNYLSVIPDCKFSASDSTLFIHRSLADQEVYFISNQTNKKININPEFRITGKSPALWNPVNGSVRELPSFEQKGATTNVPLQLDAYESTFIVFSKTGVKSIEATDLAGSTDSSSKVVIQASKKSEIASGTHSKSNFPSPTVITTIQTPWKVTFDSKRWGPRLPVMFNKLSDWALRPEDSIKYFSGSATYENEFEVSDLKNASDHIMLNLGSVKAMAKVKINGIDVGGVWTAPYELDITLALKKGKNTVMIRVVNTWVNRLIGDLNLPADKRNTWTTVNPYKPTSPLESSGLLGPVTLNDVTY